jgi:NAD(P)H-nitrite reductase large subunit
MTQECGPKAYTDLAKSCGLAANQDIVLDRVYQISDQEIT